MIQYVQVPSSQSIQQIAIQSQLCQNLSARQRTCSRCLWISSYFGFLSRGQLPKTREYAYDFIFSYIFCKSPSFFVKNSNPKRTTFIFALEVLIFAREFNLPFKRVHFEMVFSKDFMISLEKDFLQEVLGKKLFDYLYVKH